MCRSRSCITCSSKYVLNGDYCAEKCSKGWATTDHARGGKRSVYIYAFTKPQACPAPQRGCSSPNSMAKHNCSPQSLMVCTLGPDCHLEWRVVRGVCRCVECDAECGHSGCSATGPQNCNGCRHLEHDGMCVKECPKGFGPDDSNVCRDRQELPVVRWLKKIGVCSMLLVHDSQLGCVVWWWCMVAKWGVSHAGGA